MNDVTIHTYSAAEAPLSWLVGLGADAVAAELADQPNPGAGLPEPGEAAA